VFRFGVSQFTSTPWGFERDVEEYVRLGVEAIEVCEDKLDEERFSEQLALVGEQGLEISSAQPSVRTLFPSRTQPEPEEPGERAAAFRGTVERFGDCADGVPFILNTGPPRDGNIREVIETTVREGRVLAEHAGERGASVALEPLSPALMNVESAIWTLDQAMRVVEAVDRPNFGLCLDIWNVWQDPDVEAQILACGDRILVVHLSDWCTPRSFEDRHAVGRGDIPSSVLIGAIHKSGYQGAYTLEIFSRDVPDSLWEQERLATVITESRDALRRMGERAGEPVSDLLRARSVRWTDYYREERC
jgi:sugar phosphate isomerase/epimerase